MYLLTSIASYQDMNKPLVMLKAILGRELDLTRIKYRPDQGGQ
jgi:hypothetical protein